MDEEHQQAKLDRATALGVALLLTLVISSWSRPAYPLWWLLLVLAASFYTFALLEMLTSVVKSGVEWICEGVGYLRDLFAAWRHAASEFLSERFWVRFRTAKPEQER